ncbi:MAG: acetyl esterase [Kiritimatiellia bacterium]|jgi:acetyl esterase
MMPKILIFGLLAFPLTGLCQGKKNSYPPVLAGSQVHTYKTVGDVKLNLYVFAPEGHQARDRKPVAVFFFGGGWNSGSPAQFQHQCRYLASRGMVGITADYRVKSRHNTPAATCVEDAKSAIRWIRQHADELGVDPDKLVAGGGSAGGHLAACTGVINGFEAAGEDTATSSRPNAMMLFNPALVMAATDADLPASWIEKYATMDERMGVPAKALSPFHHVEKGAPPCIIFHGKADSTVPYATAALFEQAMKAAGSDCTLVGYEGEPHGFFNFGRGDNRAFIDTLKQADAFLVKRGYLSGENKVESFTSTLSK